MATSMLPNRTHSTNASPTRPLSSYSTVSTIRRVTPSPDSFSEALKQKAIAHSTPRRRNSSASILRPCSPTPAAGLKTDHSTHLNRGRQPDLTPTPLRRRPVRASPPKHPLSEPTSFMALPTMTPMSLGEHERPETPSPVSPEQLRSQYTPLGQQHALQSQPTTPKNQIIHGHYDPDNESEDDDSDTIEVIGNPTYGVKGATYRNVSGSRRLKSDGAPLFLTPSASADGDKQTAFDSDSPFGGAKNMTELEEVRRNVSDCREKDRKKKEVGCCNYRCAVM